MGERVEVGVNYRDNLYVVSVRPDDDGTFRGVFTVHKHKPGMHESALVKRFTLETRDARPFESFEAAKADADALARAWIDQHQ